MNACAINYKIYVTEKTLKESFKYNIPFLFNFILLG